MTDAISIRGLRYGAGSFALRDVDVSVPRGSIYGFLGPNGAGKTTTIRLMLGMVKPQAGRIAVLGHDVPAALPQALAKTGYVPERPHVYPALTVLEAMELHAAFFERWDEAWAKKLLRDFELPTNGVVSRMSKGETGKLMILLALAQRPELLVLDEPTDGLDPMVRRDALTAILDYVAETGATVFISSHLVHELERICDRVGVLDHGRIVAEMAMADFKAGVKRIRVSGTPVPAGAAPFSVLSRSPDAMTPGETWVVRGWQDPMRSYFESNGTAVRDVADLDLEDVFVELLRSSRSAEE